MVVIYLVAFTQLISSFADEINHELTYCRFGDVVAKTFFIDASSGITPQLFKELFLVPHHYKTFTLTLSTHHRFSTQDIMITDADFDQKVLNLLQEELKKTGVKVDISTGNGALRRRLKPYTVTSRDERYFNVIELSFAKTISPIMSACIKEVLTNWISKNVIDTDIFSEKSGSSSSLCSGIVPSISMDSW